MTNANERVAELEKELRAAHELLYLVLDKVGEPVVLDIEESRERMSADRAIDLSLNEEAGTWTLGIKTIE